MSEMTTDPCGRPSLGVHAIWLRALADQHADPAPPEAWTQREKVLRRIADDLDQLQAELATWVGLFEGVP